MELREIRETTNLSQAQFAKKFHIPLSTYSHWEQGLRKPPTYVVWMIKKIVELERGECRG